MDERSMTLQFPSDFRNVDLARYAILGVCREAFPEEDAVSRTMEFGMAVTEALNNAVEHSGADLVTVELAVAADSVTMAVLTTGTRFDPTADVAMPDLDDPDGLPEGGFGRAIIREMVDVLRYDYQDGRNILTLKKHFGTQRKEE